MPRAYDPSRQRMREECDKVGAMHAERGVPTRGIRNLDRRDRRPVVAEVARSGADPGSPSLHCRAKPYSFEMAYAVGRQEDPGANLAQSRSLLINRQRHAMRNQRIRGEQAADSAAHDRNAGPFANHKVSPMLDRSISGSLYYRHTDRCSVAIAKTGRSPPNLGSYQHARPVTAIFMFWQPSGYGTGLVPCRVRAATRSGVRAGLSRPHGQDH